VRAAAVSGESLAITAVITRNRFGITMLTSAGQSGVSVMKPEGECRELELRLHYP